MNHRLTTRSVGFGDPSRELSEADVIAQAQARLEHDRARIPTPPYADPPRHSAGGKGKARARTVTLRKERRILDLRVRGRSMREIAEVVGASESVVRHCIVHPREEP